MARKYADCCSSSSSSSEDDDSYYSDSDTSDSDTSVEERKRPRGDSSKKCSYQKKEAVEIDNRKEYQLFGLFHSNVFNRAKDVIELLRDDQETIKHGNDKYYVDPIILGETITDIKQWLQEEPFHRDFSVKAVSKAVRR
jgi:hypothetical protein